MTDLRRRASGKSGIDLIEEATHLLRSAPAATLATYYLGAIPFVLGFLYFWAEMTQSPFAVQHSAEAALATAALFIWMKFCQASFAQRVRARLATKPVPHWSFRQNIRVFCQQAIIQPSGLFIIPLSLLLTLPFAWVYAFYQNVTVLSDPDSVEASKLVKRSWKQAALWPKQNHFGLAIAGVFGVSVCLNLAVVSFSLPGLVKMLFGIESTFSRSPLAMLNTTFVAAIFGLTYLCVDPIIKTVYALRCFYGESLQSGEDLKADLKTFVIEPRHLVMTLVMLIALACGSVAAAVQTAPAPAPSIATGELDRRIDEVIHERKYTWRMPRESIAQADSEKSVITRFLERTGNLFRSGLQTALDWIGDVFRRLLRPEQANPQRPLAWMSSSLLLYLLLALLLSALAVFVFRVWNGRIRYSNVGTAEPLQRAPDIADENVSADLLPEDGWTKLARSLLESGEYRLAMRAFYLASLADLAQRNLIAIARFKSNRDYANELRRRGHAIPELLTVFGENLFLFEGIWYGMHEVNRELVLEFAANVDRIKTT